MTNEQFSNKYDLEERTAKFGERIISFCRSIKKDFQNKIFICKKEAQETKHWLRMAKSFLPEKTEIINSLWKESQELTLIFQKIGSSLKINN